MNNNIVLKDVSGQGHTYTDIKTIKIPNVDGGWEKYTLGEAYNPLPEEIDTQTEMNELLQIETTQIGTIYKYIGSNGIYKKNSYYLLEGDLITFFINDTPYKAEKSMTWQRWVSNTNYNKDGYYIRTDETSGNKYVCINGDIRYRIDGITSTNTTIIEDGFYELIDDGSIN